jgi:hypothetical protein
MSARKFRPGIDLPAEQVEANRRYWESEESVNGIADAMGISKGRLYDLLLPFDAAAACPTCGAPLGFPHRTAKGRGEAGCDQCGFEGNVEGLSPVDPDAAPVAGGPDPAEAAPAPHWSPGAAALDPARTRQIVGAALFGTAAGLLLAGWLYRR